MSVTSTYPKREFPLAVIWDTDVEADVDTTPNSIREASLELIQDREIRGQSMTIDDRRFVRCTLIDCLLEYSGGPVVFDRTNLQGCRYVFFGRARSTVHFLQGVGLMDYRPGDWGEFPVQVH